MKCNLCGWGTQAGSLRAREPSPARPGWAQSFPSYLHVQFWKVKVEILWFGKNIISSRAALRTLMKPHQSVSRDGETIFLNPDRISHMRSLWLMKVLNVSFNLNRVADDIPILMWVHILGQMNSETGARRTGSGRSSWELFIYINRGSYFYWEPIQMWGKAWHHFIEGPKLLGADTNPIKLIKHSRILPPHWSECPGWQQAPGNAGLWLAEPTLDINFISGPRTLIRSLSSRPGPGVRLPARATRHGPGRTRVMSRERRTAAGTREAAPAAWLRPGAAGRGLISKYCNCPVVARPLTCSVTSWHAWHRRHHTSHRDNNMVSMQAGMRADPMVSVFISPRALQPPLQIMQCSVLSTE